MIASWTTKSSVWAPRLRPGLNHQHFGLPLPFPFPLVSRVRLCRALVAFPSVASLVPLSSWRRSCVLRLCRLSCPAPLSFFLVGAVRVCFSRLLAVVCRVACVCPCCVRGLSASVCAFCSLVRVRRVWFRVCTSSSPLVFLLVRARLFASTTSVCALSRPLAYSVSVRFILRLRLRARVVPTAVFVSFQ